MEQEKKIEPKPSEKPFCEIISSEVTEWGIIYRIRSNRTDLHLGECEIKQ